LRRARWVGLGFSLRLGGRGGLARRVWTGGSGGVHRRFGRGLVLLTAHCERDAGSPAGGLDEDGAARALALPFDLLLGLCAGDANLTHRVEVAREGGGVAQLGPDLGRGLDECALYLC